MSRWIDIDDISLLKTVSAGGLSAKALWRRIRQQPTIDLVRCGDCIHKRLYDGETKYYYCALEDRPNRNWSVDDWNYCYWGERKESEPTISKMEQVDKDIDVPVKEHDGLMEDK